RLCADDSAATSVKVGYRQASYIEKAPTSDLVGAFLRLLSLENEVMNKDGHKKSASEEALWSG
ncbi:hypothetical protein, partial [Duganella phyllosphaerae]|uniref:hypothetical protein n=1 Tax=Duganella phyllosphaerae TaxID=762836 RepID=UPI001ABFFDFA